jgi:hypothetical protein
MTLTEKKATTMKAQSCPPATTIPWLAATLLLGSVASGCTTEAKALDPQQIEKQYGVSGAFTGSVATANGPMQGTIIPITLADGRTAQLVIPQRQASDAQSVYLADAEGLHPVQLHENANRQDVIRAPAIVQRRAAAQRATTRSWEKEALIIGGSAGAGTAIGAMAGGKKGAGIGAAAGGVGGLIYDLLTRDKK